MKRFLLLILVCTVVTAGMAQLKPAMLKHNNEVFVPAPSFRNDGSTIGERYNFPMVENKAVLDDPTLGWSFYDLQTNSSTQPRLYLHPDGTMGGVFTMSHENSSSFNDRGTGYNYYNGSSWGAEPTAKIESNRAGWPNYAPLGPTGEIVVSHRNATNPLYVLKRDVKGTGTWTEIILQGPTGASGLDWPRMVTNGPNRTYVHIIAVTGPTGNGGTVWNGLDGAIVYNRSLDGGNTWDGWLQLDGMTSTEYQGFGGDTYNWAEPHGDTLCFTVGDSWTDQFLMKSTDNGDNWTKTIIWNCPYNLWPGGDSLPAFYAPDGSTSVALDKYGNAHVVFGFERASADATGTKQWTINQDGLIYWNETMPQLPQEMDPDTLYAHGNYIGWVQDTNVFYQPLENYAYYYMSMSSMPTIATDVFDNIFVVWASMTMFRDYNEYLLRHIFARASTDNGTTWRDTIVDLTSDILYNWSEAVFPSVSPTSTDKLYVVFEEDAEAGGYVKSIGASGYQGQTSATTNNYLVLSPDKSEIIQPNPGIREQANSIFQLSPATPNPVKTRTTLVLKLASAASVNLSVSSLLGQQVMVQDKGILQPGVYPLVIDAGTWNKGVYFVAVTVNNEVKTQKIVIE